MRCADRLRSHILRGRAQGPAKVIQTRRGNASGGFSFRPGGGPPLLGRFAALLPSSVPLFVSPPWWLCAAFSFSGCNFTRLYFSFVLRTSCACVWRLRSLRCRAWCFPWPSEGRSCGGWACISGRQCSRLGASGAVVGGPGPGVAGGVPGVFGVAQPIFCGVCPDRSARASGGASACAKVAVGKIKAPPTVFTVSGAEL
nr:MAG TPA: hypothetical protein [Bacteriophage sp.]